MGKYLFRADNVWCAQYFVIAYGGQMTRDNICMYMAHFEPWSVEVCCMFV